MNLAALAILKDFHRSNALLRQARKGKFTVRTTKAPSKKGVKSKVLVRMNGLGEATTMTLVREAEVACSMLKAGHAAFAKEAWHPAIDAYFKAAAIATNVIFTSNVNNIDLPDAVNRDMNCIIAEGTKGIKMVMKVVATKGLIHHERELHKTKKQHAAAFMRKLMKGKVK